MNPARSTANSTARRRAIQLDLHTAWFAAKPPHFPFPSLRKVGSILSANHSWEYVESVQPGREEWTFIGAVQWEDTPSTVTKIRVRWNAADVTGTARGDVKDISCGTTNTRMSSRAHTAEELRLASEWYGKHVFDFCRRHLGFVVGDGECWTLAQEALVYAGHKAVREGHEPPMVSTCRVHGQCILDWTAGSGVDVRNALAAPVQPTRGDILELADAHFRKEQVLLGLARQITNVRMGMHTAVVEGVVGDGRRLAVIEQNTKVENRVARGEYDLGEMVSGKVRIYRPIGGNSYCPVVDLRKMCEEW